MSLKLAFVGLLIGAAGSAGMYYIKNGETGSFSAPTLSYASFDRSEKHEVDYTGETYKRCMRDLGNHVTAVSHSVMVKRCDCAQKQSATLIPSDLYQLNASFAAWQKPMNEAIRPRVKSIHSSCELLGSVSS